MPRQLKTNIMAHLISPSILTADFGQLNQVVEMIDNSQADWVHIDVMDGVFVPNISFGFHIIKSIKKKTSKPLDVHLMIIQPERYFSQFRDAGADLLCFHYEASQHVHRSIQAIRELGMKAAVAINPHTPVELLGDILHDLDMVLIMTVNPGYGGQAFIKHSYSKIKRLKEMIREKNLSTLIEVDGGVDFNNAPLLIQAGTDVLVAGNTIFSASDPEEAILRLKTA